LSPCAIADVAVTAAMAIALHNPTARMNAVMSLDLSGVGEWANGLAVGELSARDRACHHHAVAVVRRRRECHPNLLA
jgi:hypothetical protein